jgi:hypothetical protein
LNFLTSQPVTNEYLCQMSDDDDDDALFAKLSSSVIQGDTADILNSSSILSSSSVAIDLEANLTSEIGNSEEVIDEKELEEQRKERLLQALLTDDRLYTSMKAIQSLPRPAHFHVPIVTLASVQSAANANGSRTGSSDGNSVLIPIECAICGESDLPLDLFLRGAAAAGGGGAGDGGEGGVGLQHPVTSSSNRHSTTLCRASAPLYALTSKQENKAANCSCITISERGPRIAALCAYLGATGRLANALPRYQKSATSSEKRSTEREMKTRLTNLFKLGSSHGSMSSFGGMLALQYEKTTKVTEMGSIKQEKTVEGSSNSKQAEESKQQDDIAVIIAELITVVNPMREALRDLEGEGELLLIDTALESLIKNSTFRRLIVSIAAEDLIPKVARSELSWQLPLNTVRTAVSVNSNNTSSATPSSLIRLLNQAITTSISTSSSSSSSSSCAADTLGGGEFGVSGAFIPLGPSYEALAIELESLMSESKDGSSSPLSLRMGQDISALKASTIAELSSRARDNFEKSLDRARAGTNRFSFGLMLKSTRSKEDYDSYSSSASLSSAQHDDVVVKRIVRVFKLLLNSDKSSRGISDQLDVGQDVISSTWVKALDSLVQKGEQSAKGEAEEAIQKFKATLSAPLSQATSTSSMHAKDNGKQTSKSSTSSSASASGVTKAVVQTKIDGWQSAVNTKAPVRSSSPQFTDSSIDSSPQPNGGGGGGGSKRKGLEQRVSFLTPGFHLFPAVSSSSSLSSSALPSLEANFPELAVLVHKRKRAREGRLSHILSGLQSITHAKPKCSKVHLAVPALVPSILLAKQLEVKDSTSAAASAIQRWVDADRWTTLSKIAELITHPFITQSCTIASCIMAKVVINAHVANSSMLSSLLRGDSVTSLSPSSSRAISLTSTTSPSEPLVPKVKGKTSSSLKGALAAAPHLSISNENKELASSVDPIYVKMILQNAVTTSSGKRNHLTSSLNYEPMLPLPHIHMQTQPSPPLFATSSMLSKLYSVTTSDEKPSSSKDDIKADRIGLISHTLVEVLLDLTDARLPHLLDMLKDSDFLEKNSYIQVSQRPLSPWDLALALSDIKLLDILSFSAHHWYGWAMLVPGDEQRMRAEELSQFVLLTETWEPKNRRDDGLKIARRVCDMNTILALAFADATGSGVIWLEILFASYAENRFFHFNDGKLEPWRRVEVYSYYNRDYSPSVILPVVPQTMPNAQRDKAISKGIEESAMAALHALAKADGHDSALLEDRATVKMQADELSQMIIHRLKSNDDGSGSWVSGDIDKQNDDKNLIRDMTLHFIAAEGETCTLESMIEEAEVTRSMIKRSAADDETQTQLGVAKKKKTLLNEKAKSKSNSKSAFEMPDQLFSLFLIEMVFSILPTESEDYFIKKRTDLKDEGWYNCVVPGDVLQRLRDKKAWMDAGGQEYHDGKGPDDDIADLDLTSGQSSSASSGDAEGLELLLDEGGGYARSIKECVSALVPPTATSAAQNPQTKLPPVHWPFRHCQKSTKNLVASKIRFWDETRHFELCCPKCPIPHDGDGADRVGAPRPLENGMKKWTIKLALFLFRLHDLQAKEDEEIRESGGEVKRTRK